MFTTNNGQVNQRCSKINNCKLYWKKTLLKHSKLPQQSKVDNQSFYAYKPWEDSEKRKIATYELIENGIANYLNILIFLLARHKKKSFLWYIMTGEK